MLWQIFEMEGFLLAAIPKRLSYVLSGTNQVTFPTCLSAVI